MGSLRTTEEQDKYDQFKARGGLDDGCRLCEKEPIKEFKYWVITDVKFTFDKIAKIHHMIIPKRHTDEPGLTEEEKNEFRSIKENYLHTEYEYIIESTHQKKSIPAHFHVHLVVAQG